MNIMETIKYETYSQLCNRAIGWSNIKGKLEGLNLRSIYGTVDNRTADAATIIKTCTENYEDNVYFSDDLCTEFLECLIVDNKAVTYLPSYITAKDGTRFTNVELVDMCNRVSAYEVLNHKSPKNIKINTNAGSSGTYNYFVTKFGAVTSIDDALQKILGHGYSYYYNSHYSNNTVVDRIFKRAGVNCTDSAQVFYRIGQALGYDVQFIQVQCKTGGHIRLRLKHASKTSNQWIYRDPACVLSGKKGIGGNWCSTGHVIAYNPSWIFTDLEK